MKVADNYIGDHLLSSIRSGQVFHAYILEGEKGLRKRQLAEEMAKILLNTNHLENCSDYFVLEKSSMNVDAIRQITADCHIEPFKEWKVYLIEQASQMSVMMQNAFLKTLEEPPSYVVFILLCDNGTSLLETVRSRCLHYYISEDAILKEPIDEELQKKINDFYQVLSLKDELRLMKQMDVLKTSKESIAQILEQIIWEAGSLMVEKESGSTLSKKSSILEENIRQNAKSALTLFELLKIIDIIEETRRKIVSRCTLNLSLEVMLFDILEVLR